MTIVLDHTGRQMKPTTHSELGFRDPPGREGLKVDMVCIVVLKRLTDLGFDICSHLGAIPERVEACLSRIFLLLTV